MMHVKQEGAESHRTMQVVNHVRSMIERGELKPGDQIPPERDFARQLDISRATLRAGIGYLAALGVMKIKLESEHLSPMVLPTLAETPLASSACFMVFSHGKCLRPAFCSKRG